MTPRAGAGRGKPARAKRSPIEMPPSAPDIAGDAGMVQAIAELLAGIQQRRRRAKVRQVAWGVEDDALANPGEPEPLTFAGLYAMLDAEERRIVEAWPELMPEVEKLSAGQA